MSVNAANQSGTRAGARKQESVARLTDKLTRATSAVVTDYRGLTVHQLEELRTQLRRQGVDYVVVKNTLARRAADAAGMPQFSDVLIGPVGLALGYEDLATPAKVLSDYFRVNRRLPSVAGLVEGTVLDADGVKMLAELPSREALLSQLAGTLLSPLTQLAGTLDSITSTFASTLEAYRDKLAAAA
ncbi:MAG: 50S ribosomal protein L10 [Candidatus Dormibacteraeota bacterium]|uniref:Large ribosomal subunit protein uL10 n=1 Tax=Candidatus Amunia macphersoniae TaxID=3127014 RepID=A0A934NGG8_9BACT|nr:50S ribosomal protein L10 [Candidatus Dormibacteraeota bacterium]